MITFITDTTSGALYKASKRKMERAIVASITMKGHRSEVHDGAGTTLYTVDPQKA